MELLTSISYIQYEYITVLNLKQELLPVKKKPPKALSACQRQQQSHPKPSKGIAARVLVSTKANGTSNSPT